MSSHVGSAVVWNMSGEQAIGAPLGGPTDLTTDVSFNDDGTRLVAGRFDGSVIVHDTETRRQTRPDRRRFGGHGSRLPSRWEPLAVGTIDGKVRFFDPKSGAAAGDLLDRGSSAVWQIGFSPDGRLLAVAVDPNGVDGFYDQQRQGKVELWDMGSRSRVGQGIAPGGGSVLAVAFDPDGSLLATGSHAGRLDLWDVATQDAHGKPMRVADDGLQGVAFDPGGRLVAGGGATGPVRVWRVADQQPAFPPLSGHTGPVTGVAFDPADSFLATTSAFGGTRLWDPATGLGYGDELVGSARPDSLTSTIDLPFLGVRNTFSPDGKLLAVAGINERGMLWDVDPAVWRRACLRDRGPKPEPRGVEAVSAIGDALSRDLSGVAHRLRRPPCRTVRNRSHCASNLSLPGGSCRANHKRTLGSRKATLNGRCVMRLKLTPMSVLLGVTATVAFAAVGTAASGPSQRTVGQAPQSYYLALGDSIAYGFRPNKPGARPSTVPGYVGPFAARLRKLSPTIQVVNYGCPGESTVTFARGGCPWLAEGRKLHDVFRGPQLRGGPVLPASSPRAGQSNHRDAVGQRPSSAVRERQARAERDRGVRFTVESDPAEASGCGVDR